jgi:hypothetical protein
MIKICLIIRRLSKICKNNINITNIAINNIIENELRGLFLEIKDIESCFEIFKNFSISQKLFLPQNFIQIPKKNNYYSNNGNTCLFKV